MSTEEQQKLEKRRARRQQRILASAESRLNMITGNQSGIRESITPSPSPSPSTSSSSYTEVSNSIAEHYPAPSDPRRQKYEERLVSPPFTKKQGHRAAVQRMIREDQEREVNGHGLLGSKISQLIFANMLRKVDLENIQKRPSHPANKYWNLLHFVSMVWLGLCAVYEEWSSYGTEQVATLLVDPTLKVTTTSYYPVFWYFVTLEIAMHLARKLYQPDYRPRVESTFSSLVEQLPSHVQEPVLILQRHGLFLNALYRDICIVIYVIGFCSIVIALVH
ncbi:hypothetical protein BDB01DRAFT_195622 [Pilobolus umbonatus]|nr:hypothetical protein BDB01DRAFT_195622 [Pilobolus umbonatus]